MEWEGSWLEEKGIAWKEDHCTGRQGRLAVLEKCTICHIRQEMEEVVKEDKEDERCSISVTSHGSFGRGMGGLSWVGK